jgi:hypothetical protein
VQSEVLAQDMIPDHDGGTKQFPKPKVACLALFIVVEVENLSSLSPAVTCALPSLHFMWCVLDHDEFS